MKLKGAIFDVDGTLFDSMYIWDTIGENYLRSLGFTPRENLNETFKNMSLSQAARYYQTEYGVTLSVDEIIAGVNRSIAESYRREVQLKPDVADCLALLGENGVQMCIATATDRPLIETALIRCGIRDYFSEIFTCASVGHGKDEPVIFETALSFLGTKKEETMIFEDALYAVKTAKKAGFTVTAVYDKHEKQQEELKRLADFYMTSLAGAKEAFL